MTLSTATLKASTLQFELQRESPIRIDYSEDKVGEISMFLIPPESALTFVEGTVPEQSNAPIYGIWPSATVEGARKTVADKPPPLEGIDMQDPALTSIVRGLLGHLWAIVVSKAIQTYFPITRTAVAIFRDTAEDRQQIVIRIFANASGSQAVSFWDGLENDMQEWITGLPEHQQKIILRDISLRIHWK